jgi:hypothetical protein
VVVVVVVVVAVVVLVGGSGAGVDAGSASPTNKDDEEELDEVADNDTEADEPDEAAARSSVVAKRFDADIDGVEANGTLGAADESVPAGGACYWRHKHCFENRERVCVCIRQREIGDRCRDHVSITDQYVPYLDH